jgi:hypothetical protein
MKNWFLTMILFLISSCTLITKSGRPSKEFVNMGSITGIVTDKNNDKLLSDVVVEILDNEFRSTTDLIGKYEIHNLREGKYAIRFFRVDYDTLIIDNIEIEPGSRFKLNVMLSQLKRDIRDFSDDVPVEKSKKGKDLKLNTINEMKEDVYTEEALIIDDKRKEPFTTSGSSEEGLPLPKAAAHNDNEEYPYFLEYLKRFETLRSVYHHVFQDRLVIKITDKKDRPIWNLPFKILDQNDSLIWKAVTYSNGENIIYPHIMFPESNIDNLNVELKCNGQIIKKPINHKFQNLTHITIKDGNFQSELSLDLLFILDTTGSMGDEIKQLQDTIYSIYSRLIQHFNQLHIRFGLILYRDQKDEYVVKQFSFTDQIDMFQEYVDGIECSGGGDTPEDLQSALQEALSQTEWNKNALKIVLLMADAQPHIDYGQNFTYIKSALESNQRGIKVFSIGASGLESEGEYVFRQISALTYSEFIFLTYGESGESDGKGVGKVSHHTGDNYESHDLDDLVVNIVKKEVSYQLPENQVVHRKIEPRVQENYLKIRMDNLWTQIKKQLDDFLDDNPVGILPDFITSESRLETLARFLYEISTVSLVESQKIKLVERKRLKELLDERNLSLTGIIHSSNYDEIASLSGANVIFLTEMRYSGIDRIVFMRAVKTRDSHICAAARIRL